MLYIVGTPIGNLEDITQRAIRILGDVSAIYAEDTRKTRALLSHLGIRGVLLRQYSEHVHASAKRAIFDSLERGEKIALVSDAGMPCISDPGSLLVSEVLKAGFGVSVIPGPTAESAAVALSGMVDAGYLFVGFLNAKEVFLKAQIEGAYRAKASLVGYVAPHDVQRVLKVLRGLLGANARVALLRELTKVFEEVICGTFDEVSTSNRVVDPKGEYVLVLPFDALRIDEIPPNLFVEVINCAVSKTMNRSERAKSISALTGVSKSKIYQALG